MAVATYEPWNSLQRPLGGQNSWAASVGTGQCTKWDFATVGIPPIWHLSENTVTTRKWTQYSTFNYIISVVLANLQHSIPGLNEKQHFLLNL